MNTCFLILILLCCCNNGPDNRPIPGPECRPERPLCGPDQRTMFPNFPGSGTCGCDEKPVL